MYLIRRCLHNYSDTVASNILSNLSEAMADDSRILIEEDVMDDPPNRYTAAFDFTMLGFGGKQRTEGCWREVITRSGGLRLASITKGHGRLKSSCVIQCVKERT